ncbi:MAG: phosphoribosylaminoimidazolesuccinocarboxamide synthase [Alphaproteobacteria bacterium]|nr:phosphoribosylaminoimidazolesuccinocarboxamide synthase [Alphaproteobacteria bacterium]
MATSDSPTRKALRYTGKAKEVYDTDQPGLVWIHFTDGATAFNGVKKATIADKGRVNAAISAHIFERLEAAGVPTHLVATPGPLDHVCHEVEIIPVEVVVRNVAAGGLSKRLGIEEGTVLPRPLVEFFYKSDELNDPLITHDIALMMGWAEAWELAYLEHAALEVNDFLRDFWGEFELDLIDFKLEFGRATAPGQRGRILLADEITPDGSRLWERGTRRRFDKDVFRRDLGDLGDTYRALFARVFGQDLPAATGA